MSIGQDYTLIKTYYTFSRWRKKKIDAWNPKDRAHGELNGQRKGKIRSKDMNIEDGPSKRRIWVRQSNRKLIWSETSYPFFFFFFIL